MQLLRQFYLQQPAAGDASGARPDLSQRAELLAAARDQAAWSGRQLEETHRELSAKASFPDRDEPRAPRPPRAPPAPRPEEGPAERRGRAAPGARAQPMSPRRDGGQQPAAAAGGGRVRGVGEEAVSPRVLEEMRRSQENLANLLQIAQAARQQRPDPGIRAAPAGGPPRGPPPLRRGDDEAAWRPGPVRGAAAGWGRGRGSPETPERDEGPMGPDADADALGRYPTHQPPPSAAPPQQFDPADGAGMGGAGWGGGGGRAGDGEEEEPEAGEGDAVVEGDGASLQQGLAEAGDGGRVLVRAGEYTWGGAVEVERAAEVVGTGGDAVLIGRWSLRPAARGRLRRVKLVNIAGALPDGDAANQYTPPTLRAWVRSPPPPPPPRLFSASPCLLRVLGLEACEQGP